MRRDRDPTMKAPIDAELVVAQVLGAVAVLMTVVVAVLGMFDQPFGIGVRVHPDQMRQAVSLVRIGANPAILQPCS